MSHEQAERLPARSVDGVDSLQEAIEQLAEQHDVLSHGGSRTEVTVYEDNMRTARPIGGL